MLHLDELRVELQKGVFDASPARFPRDHVHFLVKNDVSVLIHEIEEPVNPLRVLAPLLTLPPGRLVQLDLDLAKGDVVFFPGLEPARGSLPLATLTVDLEDIYDYVLVT